MPPKQPKHLFFDLDDTLWDFEGNSSNVLQLLFENYQLKNHLNASFEDFFEIYKKINASLWQRYSAKLISKEYLRNHRFELSFNTFNYSNYEMGLAFSEDYISLSPQGKLLKPNSMETLIYLKERYALHIITNGFKEVQTIKLNNCNLTPFFDQIIISEDHQTNKPDKKIFEIAQQLTSAYPEECMMIGDNFENDVLGAINAGWQAVWYTPMQHRDYQTVSDLMELKGLL